MPSTRWRLRTRGSLPSPPSGVSGTRPLGGAHPQGHGAQVGRLLARQNPSGLPWASSGHFHGHRRRDGTLRLPYRQPHRPSAQASCPLPVRSCVVRPPQIRSRPGARVCLPVQREPPRQVPLSSHRLLPGFRFCALRSPLGPHPGSRPPWSQGLAEGAGALRGCLPAAGSQACCGTPSPPAALPRDGTEPPKGPSNFQGAERREGRQR